MPKISLRVHFPGTGQETGYYKTMQFEDHWTVSKAIDEILMKQNDRKANLNTKGIVMNVFQ